jgi:hypothetical protein
VIQQDDGNGSHISEQWTTSRGALIITGPADILAGIARQLDMPRDILIETPYGQAALGLWGEPLATYQELKRRGQNPAGPESGS